QRPNRSEGPCGYACRIDGLRNHEVPPACSRAEESARSPTAVGMTTTREGNSHRSHAGLKGVLHPCRHGLVSLWTGLPLRFSIHFGITAIVKSRRNFSCDRFLARPFAQLRLAVPHSPHG